MDPARQEEGLRKNPVKRVREEAHLTLVKASEKAGVHLQALFLQEQGCYPDILPAVLKWMRTTDSQSFDFSTEYHEYQQEKREYYGRVHGFILYDIGPPSRFPFTEFRKDFCLSRLGFAKRFCLHPALLYRVEHRISRAMPDQLRTALAQAHMRQNVIDELDFRISET